MRTQSSNPTLRKSLWLLPALLPLFAGTAQAQAIKNVVQPTDKITASSTNSPSSEGVANIIDGTEAKYLNFDGATGPCGFIVQPSVGETLVMGLAMQSANDSGPGSGDRDPAIVTIEGSNDPLAINSWEASTNWTLVFSNNTPSFANRFEWQTNYFTNFQGFSTYRWTAVTCQGPGNNSMQISEVQLLGRTVPQNLLVPTDKITASSTNSPSSEGVANSIDGTEAKYLNFDGATGPCGFIVVPAVGATVAQGLAMQSANDSGPGSGDRDPAIVTIEGSNDPLAPNSWDASTNWSLVFSNNTPSFANRFEWQTNYFENETPYLYYRWTSVTCQGPGQNSMQISEVQILGLSAPANAVVPTDHITASSTNSPSSEGVANSIDGTEAKYLNFDGATGPCGFIVTPSAGATTITGLAMQSANDSGPGSGDRDPAIVTIEGSNDPLAGNSWDASTNWTLIYSNNTPSFANRFEWQYFYFFNDQPFTSYRWTSVTCQGPGQNSMQISEVQLLAITSQANCAIAGFTGTPVNTPVLTGTPATFFTSVNGPWPIQWYTNGQPVTGATKTSFTTAPVTTNNDNIAYSVGIVGCVTSPQVYAQIFTPSSVDSIGIQFIGSGANGAPFPLTPEQIVGQQLQAYWNEATNGSGSTGDGSSLPATLLDSSSNQSSITFTFATSGTWGAGTGTTTPQEILLNGITGAAAVTGANGTPGTYTFGNVPTNSTNAVLIYSVSPPEQVQELSFQIQTNPAIIYENTFAANTYATSPGFYRATSTNAANPTPGDFVRFDGVVPDANSNITVTVTVLSIQAGTLRNVGVNALQLLINAPNPGNPPQIIAQPQPSVTTSNGVLTISVDALGSGLSYQWRFNGEALINGGIYSGVSTPTLTINPFGAAQEGQYTVAIFNAAGSVISEAAVAGISDYKITNGLVAEWLFNQTNGTTVPNTVAGGQPALVQGTAAWGTVEGSTHDLVLDGTTTWAFVSNYTLASTGIAGSAWVNINTNDYTVGNNITVFRNMDGNFITTSGGIIGQFALELDSDTNGTVGLIPTANIGIDTLNASATVSAPQAVEITNSGWHHLAFSADGAQLRLFLDGNQVASVDYSGEIAGTQPLYPISQPWISIGARATSDVNATPVPVDLDTTTGPDFLPGDLDDVALWTRPLTAAEVQLIYQAGLNGQAASTVVENPPSTAPTLTASIVSKNIVVSWTPSGGTLQSAPSLNHGTTWTTVGTANPATIPVGTGASYFRVVAP